MRAILVTALCVIRSLPIAVSALALLACGDDIVTTARDFRVYRDCDYEARRAQPTSTPWEPQPDMAQPAPPPPKPVADMAPPPPLPPIDVPLPLPACQLSGPVATAGDVYAVSPDVDTKGQQVPGVLDFPLTLPAQAQQAKTIGLAFKFDADAAWSVSSAWCASQGFAGAVLVEKPQPLGAPPLKFCVAQRYRVGIVVDGQMVPTLGTAPSRVAAQTQAGTYVSVSPGQRLSLRLEVYGDVDVSKIVDSVTAHLTF